MGNFGKLKENCGGTLRDKSVTSEWLKKSSLMEGTPNFAALDVCPSGQSLQINWRPTATQGKLSNVYFGTCLNPCHTWQWYPLPAQQLPATSPNTVSLPCRGLEESGGSRPINLSTPACCCKRCCCAKAPFMLPIISPNLCLLIPCAALRGEQLTQQLHPLSDDQWNNPCSQSAYPTFFQQDLFWV